MASAVTPFADTVEVSSGISKTIPHGDFYNAKDTYVKGAAAEELYREECRAINVNPNNSFSKQLLAGATVFDFDNGYLGEKGIIPILSTLQKVPVVELSMRSCELTADDVALIQKTFASHETLRKIDLRGITLSVASARKLLTLAVQNSGVTQILVDENTPKYVYIQKQCFANANMTILASKCLVCGNTVIHSPDQKVEIRLLLSLGEEFNIFETSTGGVALQVLFRCILACCEANDGVLFLCSTECRVHLTDEIVLSARAVVSEWFSDVKGTYPRNPILRRCVVDTLKFLALQKAKRKDQLMINGQNSSVLSTEIGSDEDEYLKSESDPELEVCTICGVHAVCMKNGSFLIIQQICKDIENDSLMHPSAFLRLTKLMISYADIRPCSVDCVVHLVRFGIYGYGGVLLPRTTTGDVLVSSLDISLLQLPLEDFAIINFSLAHIDELEEEDTCCALTVASAMSDIDGVTIDPYMIFAVGRHLASLSSEALGMELYFACEAAQVVGCLPSNMAPFDRRKEKPSRSSYVMWKKWKKNVDMDNIVRAAFSRRRHGVYAIDGPHSNLFDNTRAVLWAFRKQRRSVLVVMSFCLDWLLLPGGVVLSESPMKRKFTTTLKIVGQANIDNSFYLICQSNFGSRVGNRGFFYIPRGIFNLYVIGSAYIFIDAEAYRVGKGHAAKLYAEKVLPEMSLGLVHRVPLLRELHYHCGDALVWRRRHQLASTRIICDALRHLPPSLIFTYRNPTRAIPAAQLELLHTMELLCRAATTRSLLLFYLNEVLGPRAVLWIHGVLDKLEKLPPHAVQRRRAAETPPAASTHERSLARLQWTSLTIAKRPVVTTLQVTPQTQGKKSVARRATRRLTDKRANKETRDIFRSRLESRWSSVREESAKAIRSGNVNSASVSFSFGSSPTPSPISLRLGSGMSFSARSMALGIDMVPPALVGEQWHSVRLCDADSEITEYAMFFIKGYACCFNIINQTITLPLQPIMENSVVSNFPFPTGFDCVLNSPVNPRIAHFFCGEQWVEWDTYRQICIGGPYKLRLHKLYESLPQEFLRGIDAAVAVPNTSCAFFFSQLKYVCFDYAKQQPIGKVRRIGDIENCEEDIPTFGAALSKLFPYGPMATLLQNADEDEHHEENKDDDDDNDDNGDDNNNNKNKKSVMLIGRDGHVAIVHSFTISNKITDTDTFHTLPASSLARLPLALRQMTTAALYSVCENALNTECSRCCIVVDGTEQSERYVNAITGSFTRESEDLNALLSLTRRGVASGLMPLLRDEVMFVQTEESILGDNPQVVEVDYGSQHPVAFSVLVLVLETSCIDSRILHLAPIEALVESSDDGITYVSHRQFTATGYVTAICWGETHVARFWRIRFLTRLPIGTGIARLLWYEATHVLGSDALEPTVPLISHVFSKVKIIAPQILCDPKSLLNSVSPGSVFATPSANGWFKKHCILPLLPDGAMCLLFSGDSFVELDCKQGIVVLQRAVTFADHPAFSSLPYPFSEGFDAVFYPDFENSHIVALIHGKEILLWNLQLGVKETSTRYNSDTLFKGMPWSLDEIEDVVQIWDQPDEVFIIRSPQVIRWNITKNEIVEGPIFLNECPYLYHAEFDGKRILCVTSFPDDPKRFYVFCEDRVAAQTVTDGIIYDIMEPKSVRHFDLFSPVMWYLNWGKRLYDSTIQIDFKEEEPLLVGLVIQSSEPCDENWIVEYSDDGSEWCTVGHHRQSLARSRTMWGLSSVDNLSHRLWRLRLCTSQKQDNEYNHSVLYANLSFLTLSSVPCRLAPQRVALSGTLNRPISALFTDEKATVAFENIIDSTKMSEPPIQHVTLDYGDNNPPELMGFSCRCKSNQVNAIWSVWCSKDGEQWENCGVWRSSFQYFKVSWKPGGPRQYWRIELQTWEANVLYEKLSLFRYIGPSILVENATPLGEGWDPSVLWEKTSEGCKLTPLIFSVQVGTSIVLDTKSNAAQVVGVHIVGHGKQSTSTKFAVECSSNAIEWRTLDATLLLRGGSTQTGWDATGSFRYWRLRVLNHTGPSTLIIQGISFNTLKPTLYYTVESTSPFTSNSSSELCISGELKEVVAVHAILPPNSVYTVEKLSLDGHTWEEITTLRNTNTMQSKNVRKGWISRGGSSQWRLSPAPINNDIHNSNNNNENINENEVEEEYTVTLSQPLGNEAQVKWFAFTGKALIPSNFSNNPNIEISVDGFVEVQAAKRLTENTTETVVLRSNEDVKEASVVWFFDKGTSCLFHQVYLKGRCVLNPNKVNSLDPTLTSPTDPSLSGGGGGSSSILNKKSTSRKGVGNRPPVNVTEIKTEEVKSIPLTIIVETSGNGIDYVALAECPFSQDGNALSWRSGVPSCYWRIRIKGIPKTEFIELRQVTWFVEKGLTSVLVSHASYMLSNPMYSTWQSAAFNNEEEFVQMCQEGYDQAKSVASGLREPYDIERHGIIAQRIIRLKGEFASYISKISKEAMREKKEVPIDKFISVGKHLSNDVMYKLYKAAKRYGSDVDDLNELISHPMVFAPEQSKSRESVPWFYPKYEETGTLVESFYGFHHVRASLIVLWSLSLQLQWNSDLLKSTGMTPLDPHIASVIIVVNIAQNNWLAAEHFPDLPLLYHAGFTERPVVIAFTLNQITFTSKYNLNIPGREPFPAKYSFNLLPGVNFIQYMSLSNCPCPIFDRLQLLYSKEFLAKYETEVVFTAPSIQSNTAVVRFSLPGDIVKFPIPGLSIGSIEFEVQLIMEFSSNTTNITEITENLLEQSHKMSFVTHNTTFVHPTEKYSVQLSLTGFISNTKDKIKVHGISPNAHIPMLYPLSGSFITNITTSFELNAGETPQSFIEPTFELEGILTTPATGSYLCRFKRGNLKCNWESISLQVVELQLDNFIKLTDYLIGFSSQREHTEWTKTIPIFLSTDLQLNLPDINFFGRGTIDFAGTHGDVNVTLSNKGIGISTTLTDLRLGGILLSGKSDEGCVVVNITAPLNEAPLIRIYGYSSLLARKRYPVKIEISPNGVLCVSTGVFYDLYIEEDALFPSKMYAQVTVSEKVLTECLSEVLQETPIISALLSKGIPFSFQLKEVFVEECMLGEHLMFLTVRGVLFGCCFDVMTSLVFPDNTLQEARRVCQNLVASIVEQCDEPLWASFDLFVGNTTRDKPLDTTYNQRDIDIDNNSNGYDDQDKSQKTGVHDRTSVNSSSSVLTRHLVRATHGKFLIHWMARECEILDAEMQKDFDPIVCDEFSEIFDNLERTNE